MKKFMLKSILLLLGLFIILIGGFLGYVTLTDYKPKEIEPLLLRNPVKTQLALSKPFSITTYNIGYAGLDRNQDFFMDGGKMSRSSSLEQTSKNLENITSTLKTLNSDFMLLQEVDVESSRSFDVDQKNYISEQFNQYSSVFATNYNTPWVPVPLIHPMGKANSGLLTLSKYKIKNQTRYALPGEESWPVQLFELDRAMSEIILPIQNSDKSFVLVNLHLSAFDEGGTIRKVQLEYVKNYLNKQTEAGNYVVVGGDWNHILPNTDPSIFPTLQQMPQWLQELPSDFTPEQYNWAVQADVPTVRTLDIPYIEGTNYLAVIDGFLVSSNIEIISVEAQNLQFNNSDHHPVTATLKLIK